MECTTKKVIHSPRLFCPTCDRYYSLFSLKHICNPVLPCDRSNQTPKYVEEYLHDIPQKILDTTPVADCDDCVNKRRESVKVTETTCPMCDYTGWYDSHESPFCPACLAVMTHESAPKTAKLSRRIIQTPASDRPTAKDDVFVFASATISDPHGEPTQDTFCSEITLRGCIPEEILAGDWFTRYMRTTAVFGESNEDFYRRASQRIECFLFGLGEKYTMNWRLDNGSEKLWLMYILHNYGSDKTFHPKL